MGGFLVICRLRRNISLLLLIVCTSLSLYTQTTPAKMTVCESCLKTNVTYLADDKLRGRGSATADELTAAEYIAGIFKKLELEPAGKNDFIIPVSIERGKFASAPKLKLMSGGKEIVWTHGVEMLTPRLTQAEIKGKLVRAKAEVDAAAKIPDGSIVLIPTPIPNEMARPVLSAFFRSKAAAVIINATKS